MNNHIAACFIGNEYVIERGTQDCFQFVVVGRDNSEEDLSLESMFDSFTPIFCNASKLDMLHIIEELGDDKPKYLVSDQVTEEWKPTKDKISKSVIPLTENISLSFNVYELPFLSKKMVERMDNPKDYFAGYHIAILLKMFLSKEKAKALGEYIKENKELLDGRLMGDWIMENKHRFS
jgi:hypothetical protein